MKKTKLCAVFFVVVLLGAVESPAQVTGTGTAGALPVWTGSTTIGNSVVSQITGHVAIGTAAPSAKLHVQTTSLTQPAVTGYVTAKTGTAPGGFFQATSPATTALLGVALAKTGSANGIYGTTATAGGYGVFGNNSATSGSGVGVLGTSNSNGSGVNGTSLITKGFGMGFYGQTSSQSAIVALLRAQAGGQIIAGQFGIGAAAVNVFRVDSTGKGFFDGGTQTGGADFAESVAIAGTKNLYEPGDLMMVDSSAIRQLTLATQPYSTLVAGIYSTKPGVLATTHKMDEVGFQAEVPLAVMGIVPCKVSAENGPIARGDLLVTSSTPGHAMKGTDRSLMLGAVVGKALEPLSAGKGVIQVLVTLQ
jgi:hypothetical protein